MKIGTHCAEGGHGSIGILRDGTKNGAQVLLARVAIVWGRMICRAHFSASCRRRILCRNRPAVKRRRHKCTQHFYFELRGCIGRVRINPTTTSGDSSHWTTKMGDSRCFIDWSHASRRASTGRNGNARGVGSRYQDLVRVGNTLLCVFCETIIQAQEAIKVLRRAGVQELGDNRRGQSVAKGVSKLKADLASDLREALASRRGADLPA